MNTSRAFTVPDKRHASACGLFCPACTVFIGSSEDPERLKILAERLGVSEEKLRCRGCGSEKRSFYCEEHCKMTACTARKNINFCYECTEYPCDELKAFQSAMPHRIELWESQQRIKEAGFEKWYTEMVKRFSCSCGTLNSTYDLACRNCGASPGCEYVRMHMNEIINNMGKLKL